MISPRILIQIQWFFILWIPLRVFFPKISNYLISIHISSFDLIKFEKIFRNYLNFLWIRLLFTTIPLNSWFNLKIGEFYINFDSLLCVSNDLMVSIRQRARVHVCARVCAYSDEWVKASLTDLR